MCNKKGNEALNVSALVAFIALFLVIYVILLPPEDRDVVLNITDDIDRDNNGIIDLDEEVLLSKSPGLLRPIEEDSIKHELSPVDLFVRSEPKIITLAQSLFISRNIFSNNDQTLTFTINNLDDAEKVDLFFSVDDPKGRLTITLNDNIVYDRKLKDNQLVSINLPLAQLRKHNTLRVSTSNALFSNHYGLQDIKLRQSFELTNVEETRKFFVPQNEFDRMQRVRLNFFVSCNDPGRLSTDLTITLNDEIIERLGLSCRGDEFIFDIDKDDIEKELNNIKFSIREGDFRLTDLNVEIELDEKVFPTFHFTIDEDEIEDILDNDLDVILEVTFLDDIERKQAQILINGKKVFVDTEEDEFIEDISNLIGEGSNEIKIVPINTFEIIDFRVFFEEN